jgi:hypothetical protein
MLTAIVIEDNAGGLSLKVYDGDTLIYLHTGYEYNRGQLRADLREYMTNGDPASWDGNEVAEIEIPDDTIVAEIKGDQIVLYWDLMGNNAKEEFFG